MEQPNQIEIRRLKAIDLEMATKVAIMGIIFDRERLAETGVKHTNKNVVL